MQNRKNGKSSYRPGIKRTAPVVFISHNFSDIEDNADAFNIIRTLAADAGRNAATEAKVAGLSRVYIRNHKDLVRISAGGREKIIHPKTRRHSYYVKYKPHTVLYALR